MKRQQFGFLCLFFLLFSMTWGRPINEFIWKEHQDGWVLSRNDIQIGWLAPCRHENIQTRDKIERIKDGVFRIIRTCRNQEEVPLDPVRITLDFIHLSRTDYNLIPAVSYNGNPWGRGKEPKGFRFEGDPWVFSSRRTSIPGASYTEGEFYAVALWGEFTEHRIPFSCSLVPEENRTVQRLIWPEEESPLSYSNRDSYSSGYQKKLIIPPGGAVTLQAILVVDKRQPDHRSLSTFLANAWSLAKKDLTPERTPQDVWGDAIRYAKKYLWADEGDFHGFSIGLIRRDGAWIQRPSWKYEIGWCGQNASLSNSLLVDFLKTGDSESKQKAILCLDTWAKHSPLPNGLFRTHFDYILGITRGEEILDACNLGTAALNYFEAFDLAAECGLKRPEYRKIALDICEFMIKDQQKNGCFGKGWTTEGKCLYREGTIGAFLIPPMLRAYEVTGEKSFLHSARDAFDYYYGGLRTHGFTSAGALDTWCIDKESSMPLLRSAMLLHELTKENGYLDAAVQVSWYLSTWLWHYSEPYPAESDFSKYGYDTFGATAVSTQHHHLDPYALFWVKDWLDLFEKTGDKSWREKAQAVWHNGNQLISDGTLMIKGKIRPAGSQNEAYFQANWGGAPGTMNDWLVSWPGAFRLEVLRNLKDWGKL